MKILWRAISPEYMTLHSSFPGKHKARATSSMKSPPPCPSRETDFLVTRLFSIKGCALPSGPIRPVAHFRGGSTAFRSSHHFRNAANAAATLSAHSGVSASSKSKETPLTESIHASRRGCPSSSARRRIHPGPKEWIFSDSEPPSGTTGTNMYPASEEATEASTKNTISASARSAATSGRSW